MPAPSIFLCCSMLNKMLMMMMMKRDTDEAQKTGAVDTGATAAEET